MHEPYVALVQQCKTLRDVRSAHDRIRANGHGTNRYLCNLLIQMYGKCGSLEEARSAFDDLPSKNEFSWSIMLAAYAQNGHHQAALELFSTLRGMQPDEFMLASVLGACAALGNLEQGRAIHRMINQGSRQLRCDMVLGTRLLNMYAKCGALQEARVVFEQMPQRNVFTWTAMIAAYAQNGQMREAILLLMLMDLEGTRPNNVTFVAVLAAHACLKDALCKARAAHARVVACGYDAELNVQNALLDMYVKCGSLMDVTQVFSTMVQRDCISWNEMLTAYAQAGQYKKAVEIYFSMELEGITPNKFTFTTVLSLCDPSESEMIQERVMQLYLDAEPDVVVRNALLNLHARCGKMKAARNLFESMQDKTAVSWTSMISAYAREGHLQEVLELLWRMTLDGVDPGSMTFTAVLNAFCHAGLVHEAVECFVWLLQDYQLIATKEHIACLVDMLAKAGWLTEAEDLLVQSSSSDPVLWRALLSSCVLHGDLDRAKRAADAISRLQPGDDSQYVLMSNILKNG